MRSTLQMEFRFSNEVVSYTLLHIFWLGKGLRLLRRKSVPLPLIACSVLFVLVAALALARDNQAIFMRKMAPAQDQADAQHYVDLLRQGQFEAVEAALDPSVKDGNVRGGLVTMSSMFPAENPISAKVVGYHYIRRPGLTRTDITLEYGFKQTWLRANIVTAKSSEASPTILGFHVAKSSDSLEHLNRFTLEGKSGTHALLLCVVVIVMLFSLYAFLTCLDTSIGKRKWLWAILCLVGVGQFGINWTTGETGFLLFSVHLPPVGASAPFYGPWHVFATFPLGALFFLLNRHRWDSLRYGGRSADNLPVTGVSQTTVAPDNQAEGA